MKKETEGELSPFQKKWERHGRWLMGTGILADIVLFLQDKSLLAVQDKTAFSNINIILPLPDVRDEITGNLISIYYVIPKELRGFFDRYHFRILNNYRLEVESICNKYIGASNCQLTLARINCELRDAEMERKARGKTELWQHAAQEFGLNCWALPRPAGFAS